jgi:hypothetical protein
MTDRAPRLLVATGELIRIPSLWVVPREDPNRDGRCLGCRPSGGERPYWPCRVRKLADRAWGPQPNRFDESWGRVSRFRAGRRRRRCSGR